MASITQLINYFKVNSKEFESLIYDLIVNNNDVPFNSQEIETLQSMIITSVNFRLNQASTRYSGLLTLDKILNTCSKDTFTKYGLLWITKATQVLENVQNKRDLTLACKVIGCLIKHCKEISEINKQISMQNVKQLINIVCTLETDAKCEAVYYLIAVLLYHYPEVCEKYQISIKKILLIQIDSAQEDLANASAKCYILLSKVMERSFKPLPDKSLYTAWTYNEVLLCNTLHAIMNTLFSGLIELEHVDIWDQLELLPISENNIVEYYNGQKQRFSNLCIYLSSMLRGYQAKNSVFPYDILTVLCRGLAITPLNLKNTSFKEQILYIILPKLHISLLSVLDAFIDGFTQELIPFGTQILLLFQQTLQWTSTVLDNQITISNIKSFKSVRIYTYKCFSSWLINAGSLSGIETIINECIIYILRDIMPERNRILLTVQPKTQRSKRAMKRFKNSQYENSTILNNETSSAKNESLDTDLCKEALIVLQNILSSNSILLKQTFYKNVQNSIIPLLYNLYLDSSEQNFYKIHNECRLELFKVLKALQMNPHITLAFPMQYCLEISHKATYDIDRNIAKEANHALAELEKIIHPSAPTLQLSRQQEPDDEIAENQVKEPEIDENQIEENLNTNKSDKRNRTEEESSSDADVISFIRKRSRITVEECRDTKIVEIEKNTEPKETSNSIADADISQADDICNLSKMHIVKILEKQETKNILQEQEKIHCEKSQIDEILMDIIIENRTECGLTKPVNTKKQEQNEQFKELTSTNETNETVSKDLSLPKDITEERKELLWDNIEKKKEMTLENLESLFNDN